MAPKTVKLNLRATEVNDIIEALRFRAASMKEDATRRQELLFLSAVLTREVEVQGK